MLDKIESKVADLKELLPQLKTLNKALVKHGFELSVKAVSVKPKKRKAKKVEAAEAPAPKKKAAKKKPAKETVEDESF